MSIPPLTQWTHEEKPQQDWNGRFKHVTTYMLRMGDLLRAAVYHRPDGAWEVYTFTGSPSVHRYHGTFDTRDQAQARALDVLGVPR